MSIIEKPIEEETVVVPDVLPEVDPVTQALIDAKAHIMEHGWCQHTTITFDKRVCMVGSLLNSRRIPYSIMLSATQRLGHILKTSYIAKWNDQPGRTVEEVYEAFDKAIAYK